MGHVVRGQEGEPEPPVVVEPVLRAGIDASVKKPLRVAYRIGTWILHEWLEMLPPTIFFFVGFNFIVLTTNLLVAQYLVAVSNFMLATLAALVVGKAVLVANAMPFLCRYDRAPLIRPILFKTAIYWVVVFLARILERFVHFSVIERNPPSDFVPYLITTFSLGRTVGEEQPPELAGAEEVADFRCGDIDQEQDEDPQRNGGKPVPRR